MVNGNGTVLSNFYSSAARLLDFSIDKTIDSLSALSVGNKIPS